MLSKAELRLQSENAFAAMNAETRSWKRIALVRQKTIETPHHIAIRETSRIRHTARPVLVKDRLTDAAIGLRGVKVIWNYNHGFATPIEDIETSLSQNAALQPPFGAEFVEPQPLPPVALGGHKIARGKRENKFALAINNALPNKMR